jgi:hypothetical protein
MSPVFESFLARLYVDDAARERFLADPRGEASRARLAEPEIEAIVAVDRAGLRLAADSFRRKRAAKRRPRSWLERLVGR